jgi:hypothetical protein
MAEESESKSTSQILEILKLFQRFGRSFTGLLLLELAWTLILTLAAKLAGEKAEAPKIGHVPFTVIWLIGSAVVFVGWGVYSRFTDYVIVPLIIALKPIVDLTFVLVALLLALLQLILTPVVLPLHGRMVRRWLKRHKEKWIENNVKRDPVTGILSEDPEQAYGRWLEKFKQDHGDKMLAKVASDEIPFKKDFLLKLAQLLGEHLLTPIHSGVRIGLAPLESYVRSEDPVIPKAPIQQFGPAIANLKARLGKVQGMEHVGFITLPSQFGISTKERASFTSRLFGLDILLWGHYGDTAEQNACIYIHESHSPEPAERDDEYGLEYQRGLFPLVIKHAVTPEIPAISFSPQDAKELQIVLLISLLQALQRRYTREPRGWLKSWDRISLSSGKAIEEILTHSVFDFFPLLPNQPVAEDIIPTAAEALVALTGRWAGHQLTGETFSGQDWWRNIGKERFARQLCSILSDCTQRLPNRSEHYYRLGAVSCLLGEVDSAVEKFREAGKLDTRSDKIRPIGAYVLAEEALRELHSTRGNEELKLARFAGHAACAIQCGGDRDIREMLEEQLSKSESAQEARKKNNRDWLFFAMLRIDPSKKPVAITVVEELLKQPNTPTAASNLDSTGQS